MQNHAVYRSSLYLVINIKSIGNDVVYEKKLQVTHRQETRMLLRVTIIAVDIYSVFCLCQELF